MSHTISLQPLPAYSPWLNPIEDVRAYPLATCLNKTVWETHDQIVEAGCQA